MQLVLIAPFSSKIMSSVRPTDKCSVILSTLKLYNLFKCKLQVITVVIKDFKIWLQITDSECLPG